MPRTQTILVILVRGKFFTRQTFQPNKSKRFFSHVVWRKCESRMHSSQHKTDSLAETTQTGPDSCCHKTNLSNWNLAKQNKNKNKNKQTNKQKNPQESTQSVIATQASFLHHLSPPQLPNPLYNAQNGLKHICCYSEHSEITQPYQYGLMSRKLFGIADCFFFEESRRSAADFYFPRRVNFTQNNKEACCAACRENLKGNQHENQRLGNPQN